MHGPEQDSNLANSTPSDSTLAQSGSSTRNRGSSPQRWTQTIASRLIRVRLFAVVLGIVIFAMAYPIAMRLEMDRSISAMFDPADSTLLDYQQLQKAFGGNAVAILVYQDTDLLSKKGFARSRSISQRVANIPGVDEVLSPAILSDLVSKTRPLDLFTRFSSDTPPLMRKNDKVAKGIDDLFSGYTHSRDHSRAAVVAMLDPNHPPQTIDDIQAIGKSLPKEFKESISNVALVGEPVLVHDGFALIERDGAKLAMLTVVLLSIVVLISLMDLRFVLMMFVIICWSITITKAMMVLLSISMTLVSSILTAIVTVIAVTAVLHLGVRYRIARNRGYDSVLATRRSISLLLQPIFWTCATDAAGFAALQWSRIMPVRHFGLMVAISAVCVFVAVLLFAPSIMVLPNWKAGTKIHQGQRIYARRLRRGCLRLAVFFVGHKRLGVAITLALIIVSSLGIWRTRTETSFLKNFREESEIVMDYEQVERSFGGAGIWDIIVDAPQKLSKRYLAKVSALQDDLRAIKADGASLSKVISVADAVEIVGKSPTLRYVGPSLRLDGMRIVMPLFVDALITPPESDSSSRQLRIMLRSREHLSADQKNALIAAVEQVVQRHTTDTQWRELMKDVQPPAQAGKVTGYYVMMSRLVSQMLRDQWRCFAASSVLVWILLILATRSIRLATAALLPNLLPVFFVLAVVGLTGGKINMGAAMIAAVSIGLTIDGSVHFLASYRRHRIADHNPGLSASHAAGNVGVPVMLATIALVIGFSILATSDFIPTATFGLLIAVTLAAGTATNLTLLPAFVSRVDR